MSDLPELAIPPRIVRLSRRVRGLSPISKRGADSIQGIAEVGAPQPLGERIAPVGNSHQMDVVTHPAPFAQTDTRTPHFGAEDGGVNLPVGVGRKDVLAIVAALSHVVRATDRDHASKSTHGMYLRSG